MPMTINGRTFSDAELGGFFSTTDNAGIAAKAAEFGLTADQVAQAARSAGKNWTAADVIGASQGLGYDFGGAGGAAQRATAASSPGGAQVGSNYYTGQQVRDFYAGGGNDNQFAQQAGITDPWQRREAILAARQAAGGAGNAAYSGESGLKRYFEQYRQFNPNGANANNYDAWVRDQNPHTRDAMMSGTFTGTPSSPTDWAPGGIYNGKSFSFEQSRNGTGAHGVGDGWTPWSGVSQGGGSVASQQRPVYSSGQPGWGQPGQGGQGAAAPGSWGGWADYTNGRGSYGYPRGQYARIGGGTIRAQSPIAQDNFYAPQRPSSFGGWPSRRMQYRAPGGAPSGQAQASDAMFGDYANGW